MIVLGGFGVGGSFVTRGMGFGVGEAAAIAAAASAGGSLPGWTPYEEQDPEAAKNNVLILIKAFLKVMG